MKIHYIGDPHIGRKFEAGVPPHKRGLREARQMEKFRNQLNTPNVDYNVCVGDVFDNPHVSYKVAIAVAELYLAAAEANPDTTFIVLAGNHDLPRNVTSVGAFDAFEEIVEGRFGNLHVVRYPTQIGQIACFPWEWTTSAEDQLEGFTQTGRIEAIVGHWDLQSYGGDDSHLCPTELLSKFGAPIISGHYHIPGNYLVNGRDVLCTGSMEPYSHGEDPEGKVYVTLSLDEALDGRDLSDKCVRVVLTEGQELPSDLDCMALTAIKAKPTEKEEVITLGTFEWKSVLEEALADLDPEVKAFIEERLSA